MRGRVVVDGLVWEVDQQVISRVLSVRVLSFGLKTREPKGLESFTMEVGCKCSTRVGPKEGKEVMGSWLGRCSRTSN